MTTTPESKGPAFEWWMIANLAIGAGYSAFVALLIPPFVTETTGNAADAGIVMAVISLAAVLGPVLGSFADKYRAHRLIMNLGVLGMAISFVMYALSAENQQLYALDAIVMGVSVAAVSAVAPVFIVGANLDQALQAKRLTTYNLVAPIGQVLGGAILGAAVAAGWSYPQRFWLSGAILLLAFIVTWFTSKKPAERIVVAVEDEHVAEEAKADAADKSKVRKTGLKGVLFSTFGAYLLVLTLSSVANNGLNNQLANILPNVYGIDQATTSGLISLAGLLNIGFFLVAGWWMGRGNALSVIAAGHMARLIGALALALLGMMANAPLLLVAASVQLFYQGNPFVRLAQPVVAVRFATIAAGAASGWVIGASAVGSFIGSLIGGWLADAVGFNAINWMAVIAAALGALVLFFVVWPADRKRQAAGGEAAG